MRAALGAERGEIYLNATSPTWIGILEQGNIYDTAMSGGTAVMPATPRLKPTDAAGASK